MLRKAQTEKRRSGEIASFGGKANNGLFPCRESACEKTGERITGSSATCVSGTSAGNNQHDESSFSSQETEVQGGSYVCFLGVAQIKSFSCSVLRRSNRICAAPSTSPVVAFSRISFHDVLACTSCQFSTT